eukprot:5537501-Prymnesium_polylepis.1
MSDAPAAASAHARCTRNEWHEYFFDAPASQPRAPPTRAIHESKWFVTLDRRNGAPAAVANSGVFDRLPVGGWRMISRSATARAAQMGAASMYGR